MRCLLRKHQHICAVADRENCNPNLMVPHFMHYLNYSQRNSNKKNTLSKSAHSCSIQPFFLVVYDYAGLLPDSLTEHRAEKLV